MMEHLLCRDRLVSAVAAGDGGAERLDDLVATLHGRYGMEASQVLMDVLESGFPYQPRPSAARLTLSFAGLCKVHENPRALRTVLEARQPSWRVLDGTAADPWLYTLSSWMNAGGSGKASLYSIAVQPITRSSRAFLEIAFAHDPQELLGPRPGQEPPQPLLPSGGTLHYRTLWTALSGQGSDIGTATALARQIKPSNLDLSANAHEEELAAALDCLEFLRSVKAPCTAYPQRPEPLDAAPFALAYGHGRRKEVVKPIMQAYIDAGLLDIHRKLSGQHPDVGGSSPLEAAIWARNAGAAVALVELGAEVDFEVPATADESTAPVLAQVNEALMRRRLSPRAAPAAEQGSTRPRRMVL